MVYITNFLFMSTWFYMSKLIGRYVMCSQMSVNVNNIIYYYLYHTYLQEIMIILILKFFWQVKISTILES